MNGDNCYASVAGQFLTELERHAEAAAQYVRAVELAPAQYELVVSAATALRHAGHKQRAEYFYRKAAELRPQVSSTTVSVRYSAGPLTDNSVTVVGALNGNQRLIHGRFFRSRCTFPD
jgi:tetratricopeptide (TPR) repeat protein